jgi:hypothetical protein
MIAIAASAMRMPITTQARRAPDRFRARLPPAPADLVVAATPVAPARPAVGPPPGAVAAALLLARGWWTRADAPPPDDRPA